MTTLSCAGKSSTAGSDGDGIWFNRTAKTDAAGLAWAAVASDSTGTQLAAVTSTGSLAAGGDVWTSADSGATWSNRTTGTAASGHAWRSIASDSTGTQLVAVSAFTGIGPSGDEVWTSIDSGATWAQRTTVDSTAVYVLDPTVISDSTGTHLVLADGDIWSSENSGATWTNRTTGTATAAQNWVDLAADSTATRLVAITAYSDIWTSPDSGSTWINRTAGTPASGHDWQSIASDSTGTHLVAVCAESITSAGVRYGGDIWTSSDSGSTWTSHTASAGHEWLAVASDASGAHLAAAAAHDTANDIWTSADSGATWSNSTAGSTASGQQWVAIASDSSGTHLVALSSGAPGGGPCCFGDIWTD